MAKLLVTPFKGQHHPILKEFGEAPNAFLEIAQGDIGLLKVIMGIVDQDGDPLAQPPIQLIGNLFVGAFRHLSRIQGNGLTAFIEVHIKVGRLDIGPLHAPVLDLVLAIFGKQLSSTEEGGKDNKSMDTGT